jgi:hypothetical protein
LKKLTTIGSCVSCEFRGEEQLADIMLADFWGIEEWRPELAQDQKGVLCVLIHTRRGGDLFTRCKSKMYEEEAPLDLVRRRNKGLVGKKGIQHEKRADFFAALDQLPMGKIIKKYRVSPTLFERVISKAKRMIMKGLKR